MSYYKLYMNFLLPILEGHHSPNLKSISENDSFMLGCTLFNTFNINVYDTNLAKLYYLYILKL